MVTQVLFGVLKSQNGHKIQCSASAFKSSKYQNAPNTCSKSALQNAKSQHQSIRIIITSRSECRPSYREGRSHTYSLPLTINFTSPSKSLAISAHNSYFPCRNRQPLSPLACGEIVLDNQFNGKTGRGHFRILQ